MPLLEVRDLHTHYGLSQVLFGMDLEVERSEVVALLGRNGVGKTTTLRSVMGLTPPTRGTIHFDGQNLAAQAPYRIARLGIAWVPEDRRIFPELTVSENLGVARGRASAGEDWTVDRVYDLFPDLKEIRERRGGNLSGGQQQMLTIARSLMTNPRLLLLDEPSEGLAPLVVEALHEQIARLRDTGLSLVLAEQNLEFVLSLSDRVYILEKGEVRFSGAADEVRGNEELLRKYLTV